MDPYTAARVTAASARLQATAVMVTEVADSATATATSFGRAADAVFYAIGNWTLTIVKMTLVAYACDTFVSTLFAFVVVLGLLVIKYGCPILDVVLAFLYWLLFKPSTPVAHGHADLRARGSRADQRGERRLYLADIERMPARRSSENHLRLRY